MVNLWPQKQSLHMKQKYLYEQLYMLQKIR